MKKEPSSLSEMNSEFVAEISRGKKRPAKKDHEIHQNEIHIVIKKGDDLNTLSIPERFEQTLITEGVADAK